MIGKDRNSAPKREHDHGTPDVGWPTDKTDRRARVHPTIFQARSLSNQAFCQYVWGTQYVDEPVFMDVNGAPSNSNDCDPDNTPQGETGQDRRYFYHQDRNWNVAALTEYADGAGTNGRIAERYHYTPYGEFLVLKGNTDSGELGNLLPASPLGSAFAHQGLPFEPEVATEAIELGLGGEGQSRALLMWPPLGRKTPGLRPAADGGSEREAVLCCSWYKSSGVPLGRHCQLRIITRSGGRCYAKDYEGANPLPPGWPWGGSPCVDPPLPAPYEVPCDNVCSSTDRPDNSPAGAPVPVSSGTQACLERAAGCGNEYDPLGSNSNALLALMMYCCGVPVGPGTTFPPDSPGWTGRYHGGAAGGPAPIFHDPSKPCVDMLFLLFCTKCAKCSHFGLPD